MTIKKISIALAVIVVLLLVGHSPSAAAQTTSSLSTVEELQKQVQLLLSQMASLQKEIASLKSGAAAPTTTTAIPSTTISTPSSEVEIDESEIIEETELIPPPALTRSLTRGSRGDDVRQLQEFLAQDPTIYPDGLATGYYGPGTEAAVKKWQTKNGLPAAGVVGRQTISKFKEMYSGVSVSPEQTKSGTNETGLTPKISPTTEATAKNEVKKEVCPALPTVNSCLVGEEKVITYKSEQCGVYYSCKPKPRETTRATNTIATLKKTSSIQTDNRYTLILNDPDGIQRFTVVNAKGMEIQTGYPACRHDWTTPTFIVDSADFPPKLTLNDCGSPSSQYTTILNTPVMVQLVSEGLSFPYTFTSGKIVNSNSEASSYCYANGPGTGQGVAAECETKFGIVYYQTVPNTTVSSSGRAVYSSDSFASCMTKYGFGAESKQIKVWAQSPDPIPWSILSSSAQNSVTTCEKEYYGQGTVETGAAMCSDGKDNDGDGFIDSADSSCGTNYTTTPPAGQKEQVWNSLGLKSWIKADADSSRITQLKQSCVNAPANSNVWLPNSGVSSSIDFGMPDAAKCQRAASCSASQYFDGASCIISPTTPTTTSTQTSYPGGSAILSCSSSVPAWPVQYGSYCLNSSRTQYVPLNSPTSSSAQSCTGNNSPVDGCAAPGGGASSATSCGSGYYWSGTSCMSSSSSTGSSCSGGQYWNGTACVISTTSSSCSSGQYWNGSSCITNTPSPSASCTSDQYWNGSSCVSSSPSSTSCTSGQYWNGSSCVTSTPPSTTTTCPSGNYWSGTACVPSTPPSCPSGNYWSGSACVPSVAPSCPSGNYWNGSACVPSTAPTCPSGNYWNGSACVPSSTPPSASMYDQMRNQLKSMEIILRGLMGR